MSKVQNQRLYNRHQKMVLDLATLMNEYGEDVINISEDGQGFCDCGVHVAATPIEVLDPILKRFITASTIYRDSHNLSRCEADDALDAMHRKVQAQAAMNMHTRPEPKSEFDLGAVLKEVFGAENVIDLTDLLDKDKKDRKRGFDA